MSRPSEMPASTSHISNSIKSGPNKLDLQLEELDIASISLRAHTQSPDAPLTPSSSSHSSEADPSSWTRPYRHSRASSTSQIWSPPVSPSPSRQPRGSSASGIALLSLMQMDSPCIKKPELLRVTAGLGDKTIEEDNLPTPKPSAMGFADIAQAAQTGDALTIDLETSKPIPSLIGPEALRAYASFVNHLSADYSAYARCPSGADAFCYIGTNLQPGAYEPSSRPTRTPQSSPKNAGERAAQRNSERARSWQTKLRAEEAMQVRHEIERTKREAMHAITARQSQEPTTVRQMGWQAPDSPQPRNLPAPLLPQMMPRTPGLQMPMLPHQLVSPPSLYPPPHFPPPQAVGTPAWQTTSQAHMLALLPLLHQQMQLTASTIQQFSLAQAQQQRFHHNGLGPSASSPSDHSCQSISSTPLVATSTPVKSVSASPPFHPPSHSRVSTMTTTVPAGTSVEPLSSRTALASKSENPMPSDQSKVDGKVGKSKTSHSRTASKSVRFHDAGDDQKRDTSHAPARRGSSRPAKGLRA